MKIEEALLSDGGESDYKYAPPKRVPIIQFTCDSCGQKARYRSTGGTWSCSCGKAGATVEGPYSDPSGGTMWSNIECYGCEILCTEEDEVEP